MVEHTDTCICTASLPPVRTCTSARMRFRPYICVPVYTPTCLSFCLAKDLLSSFCYPLLAWTVYIGTAFSDSSSLSKSLETSFFPCFLFLRIIRGSKQWKRRTRAKQPMNTLDVCFANSGPPPVTSESDFLATQIDTQSLPSFRLRPCYLGNSSESTLLFLLCSLFSLSSVGLLHPEESLLTRLKNG